VLEIIKVTKKKNSAGPGEKGQQYLIVLKIINSEL
jgi:hypothetical protein